MRPRGLNIQLQDMRLGMDIDKLEAESQSRGAEDVAWHKAARSLIDIAKADIDARTKSYLGALAANEVIRKAEEALEHAHALKKEPGKNALQEGENAVEAMKEATVWAELHRILVSAANANAMSRIRSRQAVYSAEREGVRRGDTDAGEGA